MTNDQHYINRILNGDKDAFRVLVDRYKDMVYTLCLRTLGNREEAEEAAQDSFIKIYKGLARFKGESKFKTWVYRVTYNACLDHIKKNKRHWQTSDVNEINSEHITDLNSAFHQLADREKRIAVRNCIKALNADDQFILNLYYFEEMSLEEIGESLGIKANNVKVKLFRARKRLAGILKSQMEPDYLEGYETAFKAALR